MNQQYVNGINIIGRFNTVSGIANSAQFLALSMETESIPYSLILVDQNNPTHSDQNNCHLSIDNKFLYSNNLYVFGLGDLGKNLKEIGWENFCSKHNIGYHFWETTVIPRIQKISWDYLDELWVTSQYMYDNLISVTSLPIFLMSHPVHLPLKPNPNSSKATFGLLNKFTFLFCWDWCSSGERKNPLGLVKAFQLAFPKEEYKDKVQLVLKNINAHLNVENHKNLKAACANDERIVNLNKPFSVQEYSDLLNICDCYVSLHRSEGFGLTMAEAMLLEKPIIATGYSGNLEFTKKDNSFLCEYELIDIPPLNDQYSEGGQWADPKLEHAAHLMRFVFENRADAKFRAKKGKQYILEHHSFEVVGKQIKSRLQEIF